MTDRAGAAPPRGAVVAFPARRWIRPTLAVVVTVALLVGIGGHRVYVDPRVDSVKAADRVPAVDQACASPPTGSTRYRVICFRPDPSTTRGEARQIQALAQSNGWTRVAVVAPVFHISRARLLVGRCYPHTLFMLALPKRYPWYVWTYQYVRQSAGYVKTAVHRGC